MITDGVYRLMRHPQYTGIFLAVFGQLVHWPMFPTLVLALLIILAYASLARREEARLVERFGTTYIEYRARVPMFVPRWRDLRRHVMS